MALQVWLPLNGDLHNQGLSNITAGNNGANVDNNGKIGKCYSFDGTSSFLALSQCPFQGKSSFTLSIWCFPNTNSLNGLFGFQGRGYYQLAIAAETSGAYLGYRDNNTSSFTKFQFSSTITASVWQHWVFTYDFGLISVYKDGAFITSHQSAGNTMNPTINENYIGKVPPSSNVKFFNGKINDVRIYDHCLSPKEVKEISQGLILHYKLDNVPTKNLIPFELSTDNYTISNYQNRTPGVIENNVYHVDGYQSETYIDTSFGILSKSFIILKPDSDYYLSFYCKSKSQADLYFGTTGQAHTGLRDSSNNIYRPSTSFTLGTEYSGYVVLKIHTGSDTQYRIYLGFDAPNIWGIGSFMEFSQIVLSEIKPNLNNSYTCLTKYDSNVYVEPDGSQWLRIFHHNNPASKLFSSTDTWSSGVYIDSDRWFDVYGPMQNLNYFEFMVKQKSTSSDSEVKYRWIQNVSPLKATYADVAPAAVTRITTSGYTNGNYGGLYKFGTNAHMVIANTSNGNWYGATGSWTAWGGGIPGYPNTAIKTGYMDLYVRVDSILPIINDSSGYNNNGTIVGDLTISEDSPRYNGSAAFSNSTITSKNLNLSGNSTFTISCWVKLTMSQSYQPLFWLGNGSTANGICVHGPRCGRVEGGDGTNQFDSTLDNTSLNTWTHIVIIYDGSTIKQYLNGSLSNKTITYAYGFGETLVRLYIGHFWGGYYTGNVSDFRLYTTALSDEDVLQLYQVGASIDNMGNVHSYEIDELSDGRELMILPLTTPYSNITNIYKFNPTDGIPFSGAGSSCGTDYIEINPSGKKYIYDFTISVAAGNQFDIGFERYDKDKTARSNNSCVYPFAQKPASNIVRKRYKGTVDLSTDGVNPCKYIRLRVLNAWSGTASDSAKTATIHQISLREVPTSTTAKTKLHKTGIFETDLLREGNDKATIEKDVDMNINEFIET